MALPIWAMFMKGAYENEELGISQEEFLVPDQVSVVLDCGEYDNDVDPTVLAKPKADLDQLGF